MTIKFINNNSLEEFEKGLIEVENEAKSILILSSDENNYDSNELDKILQKCKKTVFGGIFPQIIFKNKNYKKGTILVGLDDEVKVNIIENLSKDNNDLSDIVEEKVGELSSDIMSMFVFVDGLAKNIDKLILALFDNFGLSINYIGGGAGSLSFIQKPCIFTNSGLKKDCAILATTKLKSSVGVKHGWEAISKTMVVTKSSGNKIIEIDYKSAFEVYKEIVENISNEKFSDDNFFDIAKKYPIGIIKLAGDMVVRDPIETKNGELICVGDVPQNSNIQILSGNITSLVNAAKTAKEESNNFNNPSWTLFIDCISRVLFLDNEFYKELEIVASDNEVVGALTLGEIANNKKFYLEFYNKTAVVAKIEK